MRILRLSDGKYPMSIHEVKKDFPNTSFPKAFTPPDGYFDVKTMPEPVYDRYTQRYVEIAPALNGAEYEQAFQVIDFTDQDLVDGAALKTQDAIDLALSDFLAEAAVVQDDYTQAEINTFPTQEAEAVAYTADNTANTPLLDALILESGEAKADLVARVTVKAAALKAAMGAAIGRKAKKQKDAAL